MGLNRQESAWVLLACVSVLLGLLAVFLPQPSDKVVSLDVGQGDSTLFQHGLQQVLVDGGQGPAVLQRLSEELPWFDNRVDVVVVTHPQRDHMEGLLYVLQRYDVGLVILPQAAYGSSLQHEWLQMLIDRHQPYRFAWQGQHLSLGELSLNILAPFDTQEWRDAETKEVNNASVSIQALFGSRKFVLYGDGEKWLEDQLIAHTPAHRLQADVLKAGHHGSKTSSSQEILDAVRPHIVAISVGAKNKYGHPSKEVIQRLQADHITSVRTDLNGSLRFLRQDGQWLLQCFAASLHTAPASCIKNI
jgi:competence protein ComEC